MFGFVDPRSEEYKRSFESGEYEFMSEKIDQEYFSAIVKSLVLGNWLDEMAYEMCEALCKHILAIDPDMKLPNK